MDFEDDAVRVEKVYSFHDSITYDDQCEGTCPACGVAKMWFQHYSSWQSFVLPEDALGSWYCGGCSALYVPRFSFESPARDTLAPPLDDKKIHTLLGYLFTTDEDFEDRERQIKAETIRTVVTDWLPELMSAQQWERYQALSLMRESGLVSDDAFYDELASILAGEQTRTIPLPDQL